MSINDELDSIIGENPAKGITKYRRRDLRNGLASRIGRVSGDVRDSARRDFEPRSYHTSNGLYNDDGVRGPAVPAKKRMRILHIPLDVSDFVIEDMVKETALPVYSNFYDHADSRTGVFEFAKQEEIDAVAKVFTDKELNGVKLSVEVYELKNRQERRTQRKGQRGGRRPQRGERKEKLAQPTADQLDQELEAYMRE
ncbi:LANO_0E16644g1_1 [Lachancea nothofagi CBS 11611]|uniref:LANO_0E16644g1_1 n=1 Tax=Lachancea nothofagi CBS 11611 TaxID=1266666 RepID=A0A1G4K255_9SACH|nr:LANO_0E16644g1_1 [Lachancea nothofagi CBS 11611]